MSSIKPRGAGPSRPTPTSSTSTKSIRATTSQPGKSLSSSPARCEPHSGHCALTEGLMSSTVETASDIRPFQVEVPDEALEDLRRRIASTNWPEKETVEDQSQGVPLAMIQELAGYWQTEYDWRNCEARLNALPNFIAEIDGLDIHFVHVRSRHE